MQELGRVCEVFTFPAFKHGFSKNRLAAINKTCQLIHLICGVSYYKAGLAKKIEFSCDKPSQDMVDFVSKAWKNGLAELAFVNNVSLQGLCELDYDSKLKPEAFTLKLKQRSLVAIGGGKDSLVTIEDLRKQGQEICLFYVGNAELIKQVVAATGLPAIQIKRKIDEKLIAYNKQGAFNGHIPITAINSSIAVLTALLFDYNAVVFSNEASADSANTTNADGDLVNHQYSKSYAFEKDLQTIIAAEITPSLRYYSYLRNYSELAILQKFVHLSQYFNVFSSCNRNFHLAGSQNKQSNWCCDCPKCRFVFLGMAAFAQRQDVLTIFGKNMLDDETQTDGFAELLGLQGIKPFECVGTNKESQLAFNLLANKPEWQKDKLVKYFSEKVPKVSEQESQSILYSDENL